MERPSKRAVWARILRIACPECGRGALFRSFFLRAETCTACGRNFEREQGYWTGGAEIHAFASFGLSGLLLLPFVMIFGATPWVVAAVILGNVALSLLFFRISRSLFIGLDYLIDPDVKGSDDDDPGPSLTWPPTPPNSSSHLTLRSPRRRKSLPANQ